MVPAQADPGHQKANSLAWKLQIGGDRMCSSKDAFQGVLWPGLLVRAGLAETTSGLGSNLGSHLLLNRAKSGDLRASIVLTGKVSDTYLSS